MDKARGELVNLHPSLQKLLIVSMGQEKRVFLIRNVGHDDPDLHPSLGREDQGIDHLIVQDQIGGHDVNVFLGLIKNIHIHTFSHTLMVKRAVAVRHDKALSLLPPFLSLCCLCQVFVIGNRNLLPDIPVLQKHYGKAFCRVSLHHHCRVLPESEPGFYIYVLIRQIDSSCKGRVSVNDQDLSVVPVVLVRGQHGT